MNRLIFGSLVLLFSACQSNSENESPKATPVAYIDNKLVVEAVHPEVRTLSTNSALTGILEPIQKINLTTLESGIVQSISKNIGDSIFIGDTIAILHNPKLWQAFRSAELQLIETKKNADLLKTQLENAEKDGNFKMKRFDRLSRNYGKGTNAPTRDDVDLAEEERIAAVALFEELTIKNEYIEKELTAIQKVVNSWKNRISELFIVAPFSGIISNKMVEKGTYLNTENANIFEISDLSKMKLVIEFPASNSKEIQTGTALEIDFLEVEKPKMVGKIARLVPLNVETKTIRAEVDIDNKNGKLNSGMFAKVKAKNGHEKEVISIPSNAIQTIDNQSFVFIFNNGKAQKLLIQVGIQNEHYVEILNQDFSLDNFVIFEGNGILKEGIEVVLKQ